MSQRAHWEKIYSTNQPDQVSWYKPHLETSVNWIGELSLGKDANIIDVGGGASTLVDDLVEIGYSSITVIDLSKTALALTKKRLGERATLVTWIEGDITSMDLPVHHYDLWHDRAVFHFLTSSEQQQRYVGNLSKALRPGGHVIMATFSVEAPPKCSGLPVQRYSPEELERILGSAFVLKKKSKELHVTPGGVEQMYLYCLFKKVAQ